MSLRGAVDAAAALFLVVAIVLAIGEPGGWPALVPAGLLAAACLFERHRYRQVDAAPPQAADWVQTEERFVDPETRRLVAVYYNSATGERRYVDIEDIR